MKKETMRKYTLLGLVLIGASAVTAAMLPKKDANKQLGGLVQSDGANQWTCSELGDGDPCDYTLTYDGDGPNGTGSRTSEDGDTSSITTTNGGKIVTNTDGNHTSHF